MLSLLSSLVSNPLYVGLGVLILHAAQSVVHTYIAARNGSDHSVKLDDVVAAVDKLAELQKKQFQAARSNTDSISTGGA